jgi:multidrug efflux pump subunit AcrA (membrane-fusion protein)
MMLKIQETESQNNAFSPSPLGKDELGLEMQEIINTPPASLVRWGMTGFVLILGLVLYVSWLLEYPEIVRADFRLTSVNAPKAIVAQSENRLMSLWVKDGEMVQKEQILAYLESLAEPKEVLDLQKQLHTWQKDLSSWQTLNFNITQLPDYQRLGEIQRDFQTFAQAHAQFSAFLQNGFYLQKKYLLQKDLADLEALRQNLFRQQNLHKQDYELAKQENEIQNQLANQKVISPLEIKRENAKLLAKAMPLQSMEANIIQNQSAQTAKQKEILELDKLISEQKNSFLQALQTLQSVVEDWQKKYILVSPIAGKIRFAGFWQEKQLISLHQTLFFIENENTDYFGEMNIPQVNFGKVKVGQKVLLKFAGYPFQEFGLVEGKIDFIAEIPQKDSIFLAKVSLPKGLNTNHLQKIIYKPQLSASAEIITQNRRLLEVFLYQLRQIWQWR